MAAVLCRRSLSRRVLPLAIGFSIGHFTITQQHPLRLDAYSSPPLPASRHAGSTKPDVDNGFINPEVIKEISGGSVTGFLSGLIVSVFSKTLVLLIGISIITLQIAARYGINLVQQFRLKQQVQSSRILSALQERPAFKLSFGLTFAMSAFMHF